MREHEAPHKSVERAMHRVARRALFDGVCQPQAKRQDAASESKQIGERYRRERDHLADVCVALEQRVLHLESQLSRRTLILSGLHWLGTMFLCVALTAWVMLGRP